jgi:hypothetical protein
MPVRSRVRPLRDLRFWRRLQNVSAGRSPKIAVGERYDATYQVLLADRSRHGDRRRSSCRSWNSGLGIGLEPACERGYRNGDR